jgi:hypothetical protein
MAGRVRRSRLLIYAKTAARRGGDPVLCQELVEIQEGIVDALCGLKELALCSQVLEMIGGQLLLLLGKMAWTETRAPVQSQGTALPTLGVTVATASGLHDGISSLRFHFDPRRGAGDTPTPGCFCKRVRIWLKRKGLRFWRVQKSLQGYEKAGDSTKNVGMFEGLNVETLKRKRLTVPTGSGSSIESRKLNVERQDKEGEGVPIR